MQYLDYGSAWDIESKLFCKTVCYYKIFIFERLAWFELIMQGCFGYLLSTCYVFIESYFLNLRLWNMASI